MKTNGVNCQMSVTQMAKNASPGSASQAGFNPNTDSQPLIGPTLTSNMYRQINPTQIGAIIIGNTSSVRKTIMPRSGFSSIRARPTPSTISTKTTMAENCSVTAIDF